YRTTNNLTGGTLPTIAWQKFMAYAHTNIDIKPVFGVDFVPTQTIIADAGDAELEEEIAERPPSLKPAAARKLLDLATRLEASLSNLNPPASTASISSSEPVQGL